MTLTDLASACLGLERALHEKPARSAEELAALDGARIAFCESAARAIGVTPAQLEAEMNRLDDIDRAE